MRSLGVRPPSARNKEVWEGEEKITEGVGCTPHRRFKIRI